LAIRILLVGSLCRGKVEPAIHFATVEGVRRLLGAEATSGGMSTLPSCALYCRHIIAC
jgi:hypothetical protein